MKNQKIIKIKYKKLSKINMKTRNMIMQTIMRINLTKMKIIHMA